ncbi:MAG: hypothetical protein ACKO6N_28815 [Myxococcota bacterium]
MPRSSAPRPPAHARAAESASVLETTPAPEISAKPDVLVEPEHDAALLSGEANTSPASLVEAPRGRERTGIRARVRTFSCTDRDMEMLERIAEYHGFSKSAMIASLVRREFWRIFPSGTPELRPDPGARIDD